MSLIADDLQLLLADPSDGDVPTARYGRVKSALQGGLACELERAGSIVVDKEHVRSGPARPCPLGPDIETMLASLSRPEPQTHRWFLLRLDTPNGLVTDFFNRRLVAQGLLEERTVSRLLFMEKTIHPRTAAGEARAAALKAALVPALEALRAGGAAIRAHAPSALVTAWLLDAFHALPDALGHPEQKEFVATREGLTSLVDGGLVSKNGVAMIYQSSLDVQDLNSLLSVAGDLLDWMLLDPAQRRY